LLPAVSCFVSCFVSAFAGTTRELPANQARRVCGLGLAVSPATMESATSAMETAAPMEAAHRSAVETATSEPTMANKASTAVGAPATIVSMTIKPATMEATTTESWSKKCSPAEPGTRADKDAAHEPVRTVVTIRRASVRVITVIAVGANRRRGVTISITCVNRAAKSDPNRDSLGVRERRKQQANGQQTCNS
jgi:hypothetical protein